MSRIRQTVAVTQLGLASIQSRPGPSGVIVVGVAGVVAVLICVLAIASGFMKTADLTGRPDRAIVLGEGAVSEAASRIAQADAAVILDRPQIARTADGKPIGSAESLAFVPLPDERTGIDSIATLRGVGPEAGALRPGVKIISGRAFRPGLHEVIVGRLLQHRLTGLELGDRIRLTQGGDWTVVGVFGSGGDSHESELLTDSDTLLSALQRNYFNSVTVQLRSAADFPAFRAALISDPRLAVEVETESTYYRKVTATRSHLLQFVAYTIGGIMALGAVLAAVNAMYSAISTRTSEIATLRALGFAGSAVIVAIYVETMLLALVGAAIGACIAWVFFNGVSVSLEGGGGWAMTSFFVHVNARLVETGITAACVIGLLAGAFPARRAVTLPVATIIGRR